MEGRRGGKDTVLFCFVLFCFSVVSFGSVI